MSFVVHDGILMPAQAVECFIVRRIEKLPDMESLFAHGFCSGYYFSSSGFFVQQ